MAALVSPTYKVTYLDGRDETYRSSMFVHIEVERRWPLSAVISESGTPSIQPRPEVEMTIYAAWLSSDSKASFEEWSKGVESVEEGRPADPTQPAAGDD